LLATAICFLCVVFVDLSLAATTFYVSTTGSDSAACTQTAPCKTLARAYQVAASADLVEVAAGRYADPNLNNLTGKSVTFRAASGASVTVAGITIHNSANLELDDFSIVNSNLDVESGTNITLRRMKVTNTGIDQGVFLSNVQHFLCDHCEIGPLDPGDGIDMWPSNSGVSNDVVFDGLWMHDLTYNTNPSFHQDAVEIVAGTNIIFRNSKFYNTGTQGFYTRNDVAPFSPINTVTLENNWFGPAQNGYYSIQLDLQSGAPAVTGFTIRNNTFTQAVNINSPNIGGVNFIGNLFIGLSGWGNCSGLVSNAALFIYNVIDVSCPGANATNKIATNAANYVVNMSPALSSNFDLHLKAGSPAIGAADPASYPQTDMDGQLRTSPPDAGADQFNATAANLKPPTNLAAIVR